MVQCRIIRTTELAAAQEKLNELEKQKEDTLKFYSPASLLQRLQGSHHNESLRLCSIGQCLLSITYSSGLILFERYCYKDVK